MSRPSGSRPCAGTVDSTSWLGAIPASSAADASAAWIRVRRPLCLVLSSRCCSAATASRQPSDPRVRKVALATFSPANQSSSPARTSVRSPASRSIGTASDSGSAAHARTAARQGRRCPRSRSGPGEGAVPDFPRPDGWRRHEAADKHPQRRHGGRRGQRARRSRRPCLRRLAPGRGREMSQQGAHGGGVRRARQQRDDRGGPGPFGVSRNRPRSRSGRP